MTEREAEQAIRELFEDVRTAHRRGEGLPPDLDNYQGLTKALTER